MSQLLEQQLEKGNADARDTAKQLGPAAIPTLRRHVESESEEQRALALECFAEIEGDETVTVLAQGLEDPALDVRNMAVRLLHRVCSPAAIPKLQEAVSQSADGWVRGNAALILGRLDDSASIPIIRTQMEAESDPKAMRQMSLATARLEDGDARQEVLRRLSDQEPRVCYEAIADFEYLNKPALTGHLVPLLSDTREVKNIGAEPFPVLHRVCDRAVEAVDGLNPGRLSFSIGGRTYSETEIDEARRVIQAR